jgi:thiol-disulfide isomerase/thioredoxin
MKALRKLTALLAGAGLVLGAAAACTSSNSTTYQFDGATKLGQLIPVKDRKPAEDFSGDLLNGGTFKLSQDAGKVTVINFWGSWCGPCTVETPQFALVSDAYRGKKVGFVGIDVKEAGRSEPRAFVKNNNVHYPIVYDEDGTTALRLGNVSTQAMPFTIILDSQHRVAAVYLLRLAANDLKPVLNKLLAE